MANKTNTALQGAAAGAATGAAFGPWGAAIGGVAGGLMGLLAPDDGSAERKRAMEAIQAIENLEINPADLEPELLKALEKYAPQVYKAVQLDDPSILTEATTGRDAELEALQSLAKRSRQKGLSLQEKANLEEANQKLLRDQAAQTGAIQDMYRSRGMGGGAMEMAQIMENQRAGANTASDMALRSAADADTRALQSLIEMGRMGSNIRGTDMARDQFNLNNQNRFKLDKWQNLQNTANANTQAANEAQRLNQEREMERQQYNTGMMNEAKKWRTQAAKDKWQAQFNKQTALAGAHNNQGSAADADQAGFMGMLSGVGNAVGGIAQQRQNTARFNKMGRMEAAKSGQKWEDEKDPWSF